MTAKFSWSRTRCFRLAVAVSAYIMVGSFGASANTIFVDWQNSGNQDGTAEHPFRTVSQALAAAAPGDTISIRTGSYTFQGGSLVFNKLATVRADNGPVLIAAVSPRTTQLRYNQVYQKSAHNTYAQDEDVLDVLLYHRIRSIEFDLHVSRIGHQEHERDWYVYHWGGDLTTSVLRLSDALDRVAAFHRAVPNHEVVTIWLDHDIADNDPGHDATAFDTTLRAWLGPALFSPIDLLAACQEEWHGPANIAPPTDLTELHNAIVVGYCGWPALDSLRGRFIFVITSGENGYWNDLARRAAFIAKSDVVTNSHVFFGNFDNADWHKGIEADAANFVSRNYGGCTPKCGIDSPETWKDAVVNRFHHIATNEINEGNAPWARTRNVRGYPFCPLGIQSCSQQFLDQVEGGESAGPLYSLTVESRDLETGGKTTDNFGLAADPNEPRYDFFLTGFIAAPSSHVDDWAKACLMVRESVDPAAPYYAVCRAADNHGPFVQYRSVGCNGPCGTAYANSPFGEDAVFVRIELIHGGDAVTVRGLASIDALTWTQIGEAQTFPNPLTILGLAASSHGSKPVTFLFGSLNYGAIGSTVRREEPAFVMYKIGDCSEFGFEDIARPR